MRISTDLDPEWVRDVERSVRVAARWNRNPGWNREVELVTTSMRELHLDGFDVRHSEGTIGWCIRRSGRIALWAEREEDMQLSRTYETLLHEFTHAVVSPTSSHDESFRRLLVLAFSVYTNTFGYTSPFPTTETFGRALIYRYTQVRFANANQPWWEAEAEHGERRHRELTKLLASAEKMHLFLAQQKGDTYERP